MSSLGRCQRSAASRPGIPLDRWRDSKMEKLFGSFAECSALEESRRGFALLVARPFCHACYAYI